MLYYDWSTHEEDSPLKKLMYGKAISERRQWAEKEEDFNYSMDRVSFWNSDRTVERKSFAGSKTETRTVPQHIIDGFNSPDACADTQAAKEIFDKWEGEDRLCVEDCAMRLGLIARESGSYWAVMKEGHRVYRTCDIFSRVNTAVLFELLSNDAFRKYLDWKGLRKYSGSWGTLIYNHLNSEPYERLLFVSDKDVGGYQTAGGDAWWSYNDPKDPSKRVNLPPRPERFADSLPVIVDSNADAYLHALRHAHWPRIQLAGSNF